jgi:hypothetical protein
LIIVILLMMDIFINKYNYVKINDKKYFEKFSKKYVLTKLINNKLFIKHIDIY